MLDYCPKRGKQNSKHKAHARRATRTRAPTATRKHTPQRHQPQGYTPQCRPQHAPTRTHIQPFCPPSTSRETRTRTPNRAPAFEAGVSTIPPHWHRKRSTVFYSGASTSGGSRTHTPQRAPDFESGMSTNSITEAKEKGERKQTRATTTRPQCAQPAGHTHTSHTTGWPNPRARTLSTGPPRPAPTYSPTPRAPERKHPSATRTHPAHHPMPPHPPA